MRVGVSSHPEFLNNKFEFFGQKNWIYEAENLEFTQKMNQIGSNMVLQMRNKTWEFLK